MNILFFLTPKQEVAFLDSACTVRQAVEKMENYRFTAIPILDKDGKYVGTLTEGDLLRVMWSEKELCLRDAEKIPVLRVPRRWGFAPVNVNCDIEDLYKIAMQQNFVPVVDDENTFIGIITRKAIIQYAYGSQENEGK